MTVLVTGGAGFIGANFVLHWLQEQGTPVVNLDKLTYAGNINNLDSIQQDQRHTFIQGDIVDAELIQAVLAEHRPTAIINFAAESHVDRSISGPKAFVETNVLGTFCLLEAARTYWQTLPDGQQADFRFLQISTDEVYGDLEPDEAPFVETRAYQPSSPYSASKASADHWVRAYHHTYGLPTLITNCSNNYGAFQFPEKLIPLMIHNALAEKPLPVYGHGQQIRDWLYVEDHCRAVNLVLQQGRLGHQYNIGGYNEQRNLDVVNTLCHLLDELKPRASGEAYDQLIAFVKDRPGHDQRYAIDATKMTQELGWQPRETFATGLVKTVEWYLANQAWVAAVKQRMG